MNLDQIKALIEAATPGPWALCLSREWYQIRAGNDVCAMAAQIQDARYVAASRTLMPRMEASLTRIRERCEEFPDNPLARDILDEIAALEAE